MCPFLPFRHSNITSSDRGGEGGLLSTHSDHCSVPLSYKTVLLSYRLGEETRRRVVVYRDQIGTLFVVPLCVIPRKTFGGLVMNGFDRVSSF